MLEKKSQTMHVKLSKDDYEGFEKIEKYWPYLPERTKGYMLGVAETNAERELMRKQQEEKQEVTASAR